MDNARERSGSFKRVSILQQEFTQRVTEIRQMEAGQAASRKRLDELFQSMLHRAFEGEL